ncbi:NYN domain-containing protein [Chitinimonas sp. BJB300]|uniref:NYN domain-containing protein n=1 Tax=Chitinimonas sp. BJB300 TaxID=1559339 RepID=UPI000C11719B
MYKFAEFVDGSNLYGSLRAMNLEVIDYEKLFSFLFDEAVQLWTEKTRIHGQVPTQLHRIYWYVVGKIDNWDLSQFQAQAALKSAYLKDRDTKEYWRQYAKQKNTQGKD